MAHMSYQNVDLVNKVSSEGRLLKPRGTNVTTDSFVKCVLTDMAQVSMQWPPTEKMKRNHTPARLYTGGWSTIADIEGMTLLPKEILFECTEEQVEAEREKRQRTAKARIVKAWAFLKERGLIKQLYPQSLGKNAGYLLLIGDEEENREVEQWAWDCIEWRGGA